MSPSSLRGTELSLSSEIGTSSSRTATSMSKRPHISKQPRLCFVVLLVTSLWRWGDPGLFREIEVVRQNLKSDDDWSKRWWEVPFAAVIDALGSRYRGIPGAAHYLVVFESVGTVDDLGVALQRRGIEIDPDPYETARLNKNSLEEALLRIHDLRRAWAELQGSDPMGPKPPEPPAGLDPVAYLHRWSDAELLERALRIIDDAEFISACAGCVSLHEVRERLGLNPECHRRPPPGATSA